MIAVPRAHRLVATLTLFSLFGALPAPAADLPVAVTVAGNQAEIGKDLILQVEVSLPAGTTLAAADFRVTVVPSEGENFLDEPYPLNFLVPGDAAAGLPGPGGQVKVEWAANVLADTAPAERGLTVTVQAGPELGGTWSGTVKVDFGQEWDQNRILSFIERRGMFLFMLLIFGFGLLMSLSPCIYPMIPITLAVIGAQRKEGEGLTRGLVHALTYAVGLALVYAVIGYIATTIFSGIIAFLQSAVVMVPIALLLVVLSFSMFGAYTLQAPAWLQSRLGGPGGGGRGGLFGVLLMGMVAGLIASPCVGPFLQGLLLVLATTGNPLLSFLALFIFGMGMSALLIAVGTFPALLASLPQSGGWMESVNRAMGLLLVAMAFYFVRPGSVLPAPIFWPLAGVVTIVAAVFMGAFDRQDGQASWWDRTRKGLGLVAFLLGLFFLTGSFLKYGLIMESPLPAVQAAVGSLPAEKTGNRPAAGTEAPTAVPDDQASESAATMPAKVHFTVLTTGQNVQAALDEARAQAKQDGKPVLVDFWASWCVYCKKLDKSVWNVAEVVAEAQRFTAIKIDATLPDDAEMSAIKQEFEVAGLPKVVFIDSRGKILHGRSTGFVEAPEMLELMKSIR